VLSIGIIGLPNVGKSTLFNALTQASVLAANYPFATIEPNVGVVNVPDARLDKLGAISSSARVVPASVSFTDIAGLVRGAAEGAGLGNKFLAHIRECGAIAQVVRDFTDDSVTHVDGSADPARDIETIRTELCIADLAVVQSRLERLKHDSKVDPALAASRGVLERAVTILDRAEILYAHPDIVDEATSELPAIFHDLQLITAKPMIYVFNLDEAGLTDRSKLEKLTDLVAPAMAIFLSAQLESELQDLDETAKQELLATLGQQMSGLSALAQASYEILGLQSFYTSGEKESRAWTIRVGATAPQAAGVIHTDFERGFIKADVVGFDDFVTHNGWAGARSAGKVRLEGRDYIMRPDDVVEFKFNV